jgi:RNA polymerase sigma-70 factor (ECF subfamily)
MRDEDFERLFDAEAAGLLNFLTMRLGDRSRAEDLAADAFERALRGRAGFDRRRGDAKAWLYGIALNVMRDHLRRSQAEERALDRSAGGLQESFEPHIRLDDRDTIRRALETVSDNERQALALRYGADLSLADTARVTGESLTTIEGRVYRGLRKLRDEIERSA